ncbi:MAG: hypothetical protein Q9178_003755 [Gyalolechia marmorata]
MTEWSDYLIVDILGIGELCYARSFEMKEPGDIYLRSLPKFMAAYTTLLYNVGQNLPHVLGNITTNPIHPTRSLALWLKPSGLDKVFETGAPDDYSAFHHHDKVLEKPTDLTMALSIRLGVTFPIQRTSIHWHGPNAWLEAAQELQYEDLVRLKKGLAIEVIIHYNIRHLQSIPKTQAARKATV